LTQCSGADPLVRSRPPGRLDSVTPSGIGAATFTTLYVFNSENYADGSAPTGSLAIDANGVLYGTTRLGGAYNQCPGGAGTGCGTVYSLTPPASPDGPWTETVLWSFGGTQTDTYVPSGVTMGTGGVLYGVAGSGCGAVFSLTPPADPGGAWAEAVIYRFACSPDGEGPNSGLALGANGVLYGTTNEGGTAACGSFGCGTVFALAPPADLGGDWTETVLWGFGGQGDGTAPRTGVLVGAGGVLYGTTYAGGTGERGVAFSLAPPGSAGEPWTETVLYSFPYSARQHAVALALGASGVLYGTTGLQEFGEQGGTAFSLTPPASQGGQWAKATVFDFPTRSADAGTSDQPNGPLILEKKTGGLFGATAADHGLGTVCELVPPPQGGTAWTRRILDNSHTAQPSLGARGGGTLYGIDSLGGTVWSLVP
jgi:hypothetical protein